MTQNKTNLKNLLLSTTEEAFQWIINEIWEKHSLSSFKDDINKIGTYQKNKSEIQKAVEFKRKGKFSKSLTVYDKLFPRLSTYPTFYSSIYKVLACARKFKQAKRAMEIKSLLLGFEYALSGAPFLFNYLFLDIFQKSIKPEEFDKILIYFLISDKNFLNHLGLATLLNANQLTKLEEKFTLDALQGRFGNYPNHDKIMIKAVNTLYELPWNIIITSDSNNLFVYWFQEVNKKLIVEVNNLEILNSQNAENAFKNQKKYLLQQILGFSNQIIINGLAIKTELQSRNEIDYEDLISPLLFNIRLYGGDNEQVIYPLLLSHIEKLDQKFSKLWYETCCKKSSPSFATNIMEFGELIAQFPQGSKANNIEIAIVCFKFAETIFSRDDSLEIWLNIQGNLARLYSVYIKIKLEILL